MYAIAQVVLFAFFSNGRPSESFVFLHLKAQQEIPMVVKLMQKKNLRANFCLKYATQLTNHP